LIARFGTSRLIFAGLASFIAGFLLFLRASGHPSYVAGILPSMFLIGLGWGLGFPSMNVQATASVADKEQGLASGLLNTSIELGAALGVAIAGAVIAANTHTTGGSESGIAAALSPTIVAVAVMAGIGLLITAVSILMPGRSAQPLTALAET
jgi:predicted MFS family arabinose efflux permease